MNIRKEDGFTTGIHEIEQHNIADSNEIYDFLIPVDTGAYKAAREVIEMLKRSMSRQG